VKRLHINSTVIYYARRNILIPLITISVIVSSTALAGIHPVSALQDSLAGCDKERSENSNGVSQIPGYPAQNPKKNIYHITAFRKTPGSFIVIRRFEEISPVPGTGTGIIGNGAALAGDRVAIKYLGRSEPEAWAL